MTRIDYTDSLEIIPVKIFETPLDGSVFVAKEIASLIAEKTADGQKAVIGLATGSTPKTMYAELVRMHKEDGLSFKNVITFNLDQYYPMDKDALQSYHYFMRKYLFEHTDIDPNNYHVPDGMIPKDQVKEHCREYERKIEAAGGLDLQILGIGQNGHIGFNEPGSGIYSKTRLVTLDDSTRLANAYEFGNMSQVPRMAITMGIQTILKSKRIILMGWGETKAPVIQKAVDCLLYTSFELPDVAHTFKKGHQLMIQIQSTWFPLVSRNPQTFTDVYHAAASDFQKSTIQIMGGANGTYFLLPILKS